VSTFDPNLPFEDLLTSRALQAKFSRQAPAVSPIAETDANLRAGARLYVQHCAECHGLPVGAVSKTASGMFPPPPQFFHGTGVTNQPVGEIYWKTVYGIRLTGMPGFRGSLSDTEVWQISVLLAAAKRLPSDVEKDLETAAVKGIQSSRASRGEPAGGAAPVKSF
jgi:mono/diheme cytochrome c family protein